MPAERADLLVGHPLHRQAYLDLVQMIGDLRRVRTPADRYAFQQELLSKILEVENHRAACSRVVKRLCRGKAVPVDSPALHSSGDTNGPEPWELERDVCERVARQLRSIGDGLAWKAFGYDRGPILALSQNAPPGPMANKEGLLAELAFMEQAWKEQGRFVLLHDLTSCLRIGDATEFRALEGSSAYDVFLHEIKTDPSRKSRTQQRRMQLATAALYGEGHLPGDETAQLTPLRTPYKTHLHSLRDAVRLASERGVQGMKIPGGRALFAASLLRCNSLWSGEELPSRIGSAFASTLRRVGITQVGSRVTCNSSDQVGRSPMLAPWTIYPLPSEMCAGLAADTVFFSVTLSSVRLVEALEAAGLSGRWLLADREGILQAGQPVLRVAYNGRRVEMNPSELARLLLEVVDLDTWVQGVKELLIGGDVVGNRPWPYFKNEARVWTGQET
ncbi:hypothetical protein J4573_16310 [Actinomadura barringtoniae]|uniref:Uncharacterized protein n=1 Tax=Actinomadura barringtoniae TaxID=1427535 RepID=A0A939PHJ4_9ACTN|nr:hypothetical protein [Actinomadura barringtoniae]MBO2448666.1 hypothetical protein [Actinomadura barringtoniae]